MNQNQSKIDRLARILKKNPEDLFSRFALALELLKENNVQKARVLFESILQSDPDYLGVYYHLGKLYEQTGRQNDAEKLYRSGIVVAGKQNNERTKSELQDALESLTFD